MASLESALLAVDWDKNIKDFAKITGEQDRIYKAAQVLSIWAKQLEDSDSGNPALCFIREMQIESQQSMITLGLGIYKASAASMRALVETALYYSYFRSHPSELETLVRDKEYYITKPEVLNFHKAHSANFMKLQARLGFITKLEEWYSESSAIIHGQIPGRWVTFSAVSGVALHEATLKDAVQMFCAACSLVHHLLLCTIAPLLWHTFQSSVKQQLIKSLPGDFKALAKLDAA
jgi:hypothetical protein